MPCAEADVIYRRAETAAASSIGSECWTLAAVRQSSPHPRTRIGSTQPRGCSGVVRLGTTASRGRCPCLNVFYQHRPPFRFRSQCTVRRGPVPAHMEHNVARRWFSYLGRWQRWLHIWTIVSCGISTPCHASQVGDSDTGRAQLARSGREASTIGASPRSTSTPESRSSSVTTKVRGLRALRWLWANQCADVKQTTSCSVTGSSYILSFPCFTGRPFYASMSLYGSIPTITTTKSTSPRWKMPFSLRRSTWYSL